MRKTFRHLLLLLAFASFGVSAQNVVTTSPASPTLDTSPDVYRSTTKIGSNAPTLQACIDSIKADAAKRAPGTYAYSCRPGITSITATVTAPPPCPPAPANETRAQSCPAGTTGTWTQVRTYNPAPQPTCWVAGEWLPLTAPAGACVAPPTQTTGTWLGATAGIGNPQFVPPNAPDAGVTFFLNGALNRTDLTANPYEFYPPITMRDGDVLRAEWTSGGVANSSSVTVGSSAPPPPPPPPPPTTTGSATLQWDAVADARAIGYRVYWGTAPRTYSQPFGSGVLVSATTYIVTGLPAGATYYFAVTAVAEGSESGYSNEASKNLP